MLPCLLAHRMCSPPSQQDSSSKSWLRQVVHSCSGVQTSVQTSEIQKASLWHVLRHQAPLCVTSTMQDLGAFQTMPHERLASANGLPVGKRTPVIWCMSPLRTTCTPGTASLWHTPHHRSLFAHRKPSCRFKLLQLLMAWLELQLAKVCLQV